MTLPVFEARMIKIQNGSLIEAALPV